MSLPSSSANSPRAPAAIERWWLAQPGRKLVELGVLLPGRLDVTDLEQVVHTPVVMSAMSSWPAARGELGIDAEALVEVADVEQRHMAGEEDREQKALVAELLSDGERLFGKLVRAVVLVGISEVLRQPREEPRTQRSRPRSERDERLLEEIEVLGVRVRHLEVAFADTVGGTGEALGVADARRKRRHRGRRRAPSPRRPPSHPSGAHPASASGTSQRPVASPASESSSASTKCRSAFVGVEPGVPACFDLVLAGRLRVPAGQGIARRLARPLEVERRLGRVDALLLAQLLGVRPTA